MNTSSLHHPKFGVSGGLPVEELPPQPFLPPSVPSVFHFQTQTPSPHPMATMSKAVPVETKPASPAKVKTEGARPEVAAATHARDKNIELALSSITKQFGEGSIMRL